MKMPLMLSICLLLLMVITGCQKKQPYQPPPYNNEPYDEVEYDPCFSPDGNTIAYAMAESIGDSSGIFLIDADGTNKRLFLRSDGFIRLWAKPDWSPDGRWLLLNDVRSAQIFKIRVPEGDSLTQLTFEGRNFFPSWSPDGKRIAWDTNYNDSLGANVIWIMNDDGLNKKDISQHQIGEWRMPDWLPDGRIVHIRYPGGSVVSSEIFIMDSIGQNAIRLTYNNNTDRRPKASPDGLRIVFSSQANEEWPKIWVVNADGSNPTQLTETGANLPCWSPDGSKIVYCNTSVDGRLWIMNSDGSNKRRLTP